jgi:hypothetical protein
MLELPRNIPEPEPITEAILSRLSSNFTKCVKGYHLVNDDPIKESPWEQINATIFEASGCSVISQSKGSHNPGKDLLCYQAIYNTIMMY